MSCRDCRCRLAVTLRFHRDSLVFNVSCLKPGANTPYYYDNAAHKAVVHYCPWWDVVRMFSILVVHTGRTPISES